MALPALVLPAASAGASATAFRSFASIVDALGTSLRESGIVEYVGQLIGETAELGDIADQIGFTADRLQRLRFAAEASGTSAEAMDEALSQLNLRLGEAALGNDDYSAAFERLSINILDGNENIRGTEEVFNDLLDAFQNVESDAGAAALAARLLGRDFGPDLVPLLRGGQQGIDELAGTIRTIDEEGVRTAQSLSRGWGEFASTIETEVTKAIIDLAEEIRNISGIDLVSLIVDRSEEEILQRRIEEARERFQDLESYAQETDRIIGERAGDYRESERTLSEYQRRGYQEREHDWIAQRDGARAEAAQLREQIREDEAALDALRNPPLVTDRSTTPSDEGGEEDDSDNDGGRSDERGTPPDISRFGNLGGSPIGGGEDPLTAVRDAIGDLGYANELLRQQIGAFRQDAGFREMTDEAIELETAANRLGVAFGTELGESWAQLYRESQKLNSELSHLQELFAEGERLTQQYRTEGEILADTQARLAELFEAGAISAETYQRALADIDPLQRDIQFASQQLASAFGDFAASAILDSDNIGAALERLGQRITQLVLELTVIRPLENALGNLFSSIPGLLGLDFGGGKAGLPAGKPVPKVPKGFAEGGRPPVGLPSLVGERGPEIFVPDVAGTILPNGAAPPINVNVINNTPAEVDVQQRGPDLDIVVGDMIDRQVARGRLDGTLRRRYGVSPSTAR